MQRKPTRRKIIEGDASQRGKGFLQRKLASEPHAQDGLPPASMHLPARAREVFEFWAEQLELMQIDARPDAIALEAAAMAYHRAVEAELMVQRDGLILHEAIYRRGKCVPGLTRLRKHPACALAARSWQRMRAFAVQFGLTPIAHTRFAISDR